MNKDTMNDEELARAFSLRLDEDNISARPDDDPELKLLLSTFVRVKKIMGRPATEPHNPIKHNTFLVRKLSMSYWLEYVRALLTLASPSVILFLIVAVVVFLIPSVLAIWTSSTSNIQVTRVTEGHSFPTTNNVPLLYNLELVNSGTYDSVGIEAQMNFSDTLLNFSDSLPQVEGQEKKYETIWSSALDDPAESVSFSATEKLGPLPGEPISVSFTIKNESGTSLRLQNFGVMATFTRTGQTASFEYDAANRLIRVRDYEDNIVQYGYDQNDLIPEVNLIRLKDGTMGPSYGTIVFGGGNNRTIHYYSDGAALKWGNPSLSGVLSYYVASDHSNWSRIRTSASSTAELHDVRNNGYRFSTTYGLALAPAYATDRSLYVADSANHRLQTYSRQEKELYWASRQRRDVTSNWVSTNSDNILFWSESGRWTLQETTLKAPRGYSYYKEIGLTLDDSLGSLRINRRDKFVWRLDSLADANRFGAQDPSRRNGELIPTILLALLFGIACLGLIHLGLRIGVVNSVWLLLSNRRRSVLVLLPSLLLPLSIRWRSEGKTRSPPGSFKVDLFAQKDKSDP